MRRAGMFRSLGRFFVVCLQGALVWAIGAGAVWLGFKVLGPLLCARIEAIVP